MVNGRQRSVITNEVITVEGDNMGWMARSAANPPYHMKTPPSIFQA